MADKIVRDLDDDTWEDKGGLERKGSVFDPY